MITGLLVVQFVLQSYEWLTNWTSASRSSDFVNHSYDYRPNWTPLGPITIIYQNYYKILERDWLSPVQFEHE